MTNTGKLLIVGLLLIDAGIAGYLLFPKDDKQLEVAGTVTGSPDNDAALDSQGGSSRVTGGSVLPALSADGAAGKAGQLPRSQQSAGGALPAQNVVPAAPAAPAPAPALAAAPAPSAAPDAGQIVTGRIDSAVPAAPVAPAPAQPPVSARAQAQPLMQPQPQPQPLPQAQAQPQPRPRPAQRVEQAQVRRYDVPRANGANPYSNAIPNANEGTNAVSAALTQQLVRESARPDPSLPIPSGAGAPPQPPMPTMPQMPMPTGRGSNPVASAMTDQLVRESAKPDPSLPMPSGVSVPLQPQMPASRSTNPAASAMTDRLVRESSNVTPTQQAPSQAAGKP
ncbi:hypothetical protein GXB81_27175 [Paraburkholderia sp. Ac-20336]|uniref:hypothetical protein n=1 Tax=Paraburkholderia sp. Ac-20336 TaxID=2703886 RepID=UPI0019816958|nr:hypothetical protein [Paraburkholderia sp. Ac-20336]MBN3806702.1 hypothetical protein [Paraburkholderia sp. Ac-20336]